jgi:hypothetical protein
MGCTVGNFTREEGRPTLDDVDDLAVALQDVDALARLLVPDEEVAAVAAADDVFVLQAVEVDVLRSVDVAVTGVTARVVRASDPLARRRS